MRFVIRTIAAAVISMAAKEFYRRMREEQTEDGMPPRRNSYKS